MAAKELGSGEGCRLGACDPGLDHECFAGDNLAEDILADGDGVTMRVARTVGRSSLNAWT